MAGDEEDRIVEQGLGLRAEAEAVVTPLTRVSASAAVDATVLGLCGAGVGVGHLTGRPSG